MDDNALLNDFLKGNESAFKELITRHQKGLYRFVWLKVGNHDDAADICQSCFIQVHKKAEQFQAKASFKSWLYKIAINFCKNHYRSKDRQRIDSSTDPDTLENTGDDTGWTQCMDQEKKARIQTVIKNLPDKQRTTIELRFFQECTLKQVAEIMDCPIGTAKANYHHALTTLRKLITGDDYEY